MTSRDKAVEAALTAWYGGAWPAMSPEEAEGMRVDMRAALSAASAAQEQCICDVCAKPVEFDLLVDDALWAKISPRTVEGFKGGGVLCPSCIFSRSIAASAAEGGEAVAWRWKYEGKTGWCIDSKDPRGPDVSHMMPINSVEPLYTSPSPQRELEMLPRLENCGQYLAKDNTGQWHYINHAGTWQGCPPPFPSAGEGDKL